MVDQFLEELSEITSLNADDLVYIVRQATGNADHQATWQTLLDELAAGGGTVTVGEWVDDVATTKAVGNALKLDLSLAQADDVANYAHGIVAVKETDRYFVVWGRGKVTWTGHGLTGVAWLSPATPGLIVDAEPAPPNDVQPLLIVIDANTVMWDPVWYV